MPILDELKKKANGKADSANNIAEAIAQMDFSDGGGGSVTPEEISEAVSAYLDEHLTNPTNPPIDTSLSIAGAAADAKETGDKISELKEDLTTLTIDHDVVTEYNYNTDGIIKDDGHYINADGSFGNSSDYTYIAAKMPTDCDVYATVDTTWHQLAIYNGLPFGTSTFVAVYGSSIPLPTAESPLHVTADNYVVLVKKQPTTREYSIFAVTTELYSLNEQTMIPETNARLTALEGREFDTSGQSGALVYRKILPSYYFDMPETVTDFDDDEYLQSRINAIPSGKHFIFVTDTHWDGTYNGDPNNNKKSNLLINYVRQKIGDVDVVFGGDVINANPTKYEAVRVAKQYINECIDAFGDRFIPVLGNHDLNVIGQTGDADTYCIPYPVITPIFTEHLGNRATFRDESVAIATKTSDATLAAEYDAYFKMNYVVNTDDGITFIVYNTGAHGEFVRDNFGIHGSDEIYLHQQWLYNALMHVPEGNDVVLCGHEVTYGITSPLESWHMRSAVLQLCGLVSKSVINLYQMANVISESTYPWIPNTQYPSYDFTDAPTVGKVFALQGHWHHDFVVKVGISNDTSITRTLASIWDGTPQFLKANGEIPIIATICDAAGQYRNESDYATIPADFTMQSGTVTEQAFDVVTITESGIVTTRFGAAEKPSDLQRVFAQS